MAEGREQTNGRRQSQQTADRKHGGRMPETWGVTGERDRLTKGEMKTERQPEGGDEDTGRQMMK